MRLDSGMENGGGFSPTLAHTKHHQEGREQEAFPDGRHQINIDCHAFLPPLPLGHNIFQEKNKGRT